MGQRYRYAELHVHSHFSFLDGASSPEALVHRGSELGLDALALTDHHGLYGVVRFAEAARRVGLPTVFGAEVTLDATQSRTGVPDPAGDRLVVLARTPRGYARLARALTAAQMAGEKAAPKIGLDDLIGTLRGGSGGAGNFGDEVVLLTGGRKGYVAAALEREGPRAAQRRLQRLVDRCGTDALRVEIWDHADPVDNARNDALVEIAHRVGVEVVATNNVHYATTHEYRLASAFAAVRARRTLDDLEPWMPGGWMASLRSGADQARRFARYPGAVERAGELGLACAFDLALVAPQLPPYDCPCDEGGQQLSEIAFLRQLVMEGAAQRYGQPDSHRWMSFVAHHGSDPYQQLAHELDLIEMMGFAGYFLIVWDIVEFCRRHNILCQGRGSAANSAVCYAIGVTNADAVALGLLFERFLSPERDGPPDIDIDIESDRREEVIQYVYHRYGRMHAAQVANVITYRGRSAVRDAAKALGFSQGQQDAFARSVDRYSGLRQPLSSSGQTSEGGGIPLSVLELAAQFEHAPRHLGIHSGGMVICDRPVIEVCPTEWARMENRSVLQWDKEDCAAAGLVKFDLLGLGMLSALHETIDLVHEHFGVEVDLAQLPQEDEVYDMICEADTIGVFQIESRAQMGTLPRLRPRTFYDLVIEVALIRPGPIQGGSVHPYIRRRNGLEPVTYLHPLLENALAKTLGVPLFQEQLMQIAIDAAGFSPSEADLLRQAIGSKRSVDRLEQLRERMFSGMAERGIPPAVGEEIFAKIVAFAHYGFPESHSVSFAFLVYASCWLKFHYPAAFCVGLLRSQPMGFYSPHTLVQDARRHGVKTLGPDINHSQHWASLATEATSLQGVAIRLGLDSVRHVGAEFAKKIVGQQPFHSIEDFAHRTGPSKSALEALATAGAFQSCRGSAERRGDLWTAGAHGLADQGRLPGIVVGTVAPHLPSMTPPEQAASDLWATGIAPEGHPTTFIREELNRLGVVLSKDLHHVDVDRHVRVAGVITHRQRPETAGGTLFLNLEDESGLINVVCSRGFWTRHRRIVFEAPAALVVGTLDRVDGVVNVIAHAIKPLALAAPARSRDFH